VSPIDTSPNIGSVGDPNWSSPAGPVSTDNNVPSTLLGSQGTEGQNPPSNESVQPPAGFPLPKQAEASLEASAMKATINAIPINQAAPQRHDYAAEAKANWEANTSPAQKAAAAQSALPPLQTFVGKHERAVEKAAGVFDNLPFLGDAAKLGHHLAELVTGTDASGNAIDRSEKSREISREVLKEVVGHVSGEAVGEFYGEAVSGVGGKGAGFIANKLMDNVADEAAGEITGTAARHIAGDDAAEE
jgi:hypothetical protein